jgi:hypothetical protein
MAVGVYRPAGFVEHLHAGLLRDRSDLVRQTILEPTKREQTIGVTLVPELTHPDGRRAPLCLCPGQVRPFTVRDSGAPIRIPWKRWRDSVPDHRHWKTLEAADRT